MTQREVDRPSPLAAFRVQSFRMLWFTWVIANMCMWMSDVAATWVMTTLTTQPIWVALVQTAATLPIFLLGLPSGALADILDRKRFLLATQTLVAMLFACTSAAIFLDVLTPAWLLVLTLAGGIGMAMRWPVFVAMVSESVPRSQLPAALALNGLPMNGSRIFGPLVAGLLIVSLGSGWVFLLNAVFSLIAVFIVARWPRPPGMRTASKERLTKAMRVGVQFVWNSATLKGVLLRAAVFFLHSTALQALLPLMAQRLEGGPKVFAVLLACMGVGAMLGIFTLANLRRRITRDAMLFWGTVVQAVAMGLMTATVWLPMTVVAMFFAGLAWMIVVNTLAVSAQMSLPDWVRARGMAMFQMAIMGSSAMAAALWGQVATWSSVPLALGLAALSSVPAMWLANRLGPDYNSIDPIPAPLKS